MAAKIPASRMATVRLSCIGAVLVALPAQVPDAPAARVGQARATTPIEVRIETGGDVDVGTRSQWGGPFENIHGTLFWNGSNWVSNSTAAHAYFYDTRTGEKLYRSTLTVVDSSATTVGQQPGMPAGFIVTKRIFSYMQPAAAGGADYRYQAVEYETAQPDGTTVLLRTRGTGNGTDQAHLDACIEDGKGNTTAMLGDAVWLRSTGMTAAQAAAQRADVVPGTHVVDER